MPARLYLDTARMGLISPSAHRALIDFARLAGEEGLTLYFERFLRHGADAWPTRLTERFPGLTSWQGVRGLKKALLRQVGTTSPQNVFFSNRTAQLMRLGARLMFGRCRRVLVTDLSWPSYRRILKKECKRAEAHLLCIPIRRMLLKKRAPVDHLVDHVARRFLTAGCDGLFLPEVSHDGLRLPVRAVREAASPEFVLVDGAQAFCHVPNSQTVDASSFYVSGAHKWLRAHLPMGIAVVSEELKEEARRMANSIDDPLLHFAEQLESDAAPAFSETVNVLSMFTLQGALADLSDQSTSGTLETRLQNAAHIVEVCRDSHWQPIAPADEMSTGILLLRALGSEMQGANAARIRHSFLASGIALTTYDHGVLRLSMPDQLFGPWQVDQVRRALVSISSTDCRWKHDCHVVR